MVMGAPPFTANTRKATIDKILKGRIRITQDDMSDEARDLLKSLLKRNVDHRLGAGPGDAEEIKIHPFFADIDWELVKNRQVGILQTFIKPIFFFQLEPPFRPMLSQADDVSMFASKFTELPAIDSPTDPVFTSSVDINPFEGFSYVAPNVLHMYFERV
jgi:serine/threonine protein kinase